jgi:hypothetical protein
VRVIRGELKCLCALISTSSGQAHAMYLGSGMTTLAFVNLEYRLHERGVHRGGGGQRVSAAAIGPHLGRRGDARTLDCMSCNLIAGDSKTLKDGVHFPQVMSTTS